MAITVGKRVILAYVLSGISFIGVTGIWAAIPIGWFLADFTGIIIYFYMMPGSKGLKKYEQSMRIGE